MFFSLVHSEYSGINFLDDPQNRHITSAGANIELDNIGVAVSIPKQKEKEDSVDLLIRPCLNGPFKLPTGYKLASPIYLIEPSKKGTLQKPATVSIHHYANLVSEEDCAGMVFVSASATPRSTHSGPEYIFKKIEGSKKTFKPGSQVGQIELQHFCLMGICSSKY